MDILFWFLFGLVIGTMLGWATTRWIVLKGEESKLKIGSKVYVIVEEDPETVYIDELTVTEVGTKRIFCSGYVPPKDDLDCDFPIDEIGKTVFLTPEAAEEEIKKRTEAHSDSRQTNRETSRK